MSLHIKCFLVPLYLVHQDCVRGFFPVQPCTVCVAWPFNQEVSIWVNPHLIEHHSSDDHFTFHSGDYLNNYFEFVGVNSCQEVHLVYIMIWLMTALNVSAFLLGIITTAILGSFKNMVRKWESARSYIMAIFHFSCRGLMTNVYGMNGGIHWNFVGLCDLL